MSSERLFTGSTTDRLTLIGLMCAVLTYALLFYDAGTVSWFWLFVGIVSWAIAAGPVAWTSSGKSIGAWFRRIGYGGRLIAIITAAGVVGAFVFFYQPPMASFISFFFGGLIGLVGVSVGEQFLV